MRRALFAVLVSLAALVGFPAAGRAAPRAPDPVVTWNQFLLGLQATPGVQPATVHPTYELAIVHAAIYDAVVAIDHGGAPYRVRVAAPRTASRRAAADAAAHDTLTALYPSQRTAIDREYAARIAQVTSGRARDQGLRVGEEVARRLLAIRRGDGSDGAPEPFLPGTDPGEYRLTPPAFASPVFTHWSHVAPFALRRADQFRPPAPPALTSARYAAAIEEVRALGVAQGSTRTADQTQIGLFWNPPIWTAWNRIAENVAVARGDGLDRDARTFAALDVTLADSVIAFYDAKHVYRLWRPVTAIRNADADGNPATVQDPNWTPLSTTAPDPSYPGAHGTVSAAAADVLASAYGNDVSVTLDSPALPGVTRSFTSFTEAAEEASVSRIYNGNHSRLDQMAGENLGHDVARFVLRNDFRRRDGHGRRAR